MHVIAVLARPTRSRRILTAALAPLLLAAVQLAGCGASTPATPTQDATPLAPTPAVATPTPASAAATSAAAATAVLSAASEAVLSLDLASPPAYANPSLPAHYDLVVRALDNTPPGNPVTDRGATLGRVLFHDRNLSVNGAIACASCHRQSSGFDDPARFSTGFSGAAFTTAHAMRLANLRYYAPGSTFWDRRTASVEAQATQPIQHPVEMGFDATQGGLAALISRMQSLTYYPELFAWAFGDGAITEDRIQRALAQFERAMVSTDSAWDRGYATVFDPALPDRGLGADLPTLSAVENRGRRLFMTAPGQGGAGCAGCHVPPTFALAANSRSNGLDAGETRIFKSPSLKSVALSGAFMHDGRFATLEQVIEHYDGGVQDGPALDPRLQVRAGLPRRLNLDAADKAALVAFLRTLTDTTLAADPKFASPFRR